LARWLLNDVSELVREQTVASDRLGRVLAGTEANVPADGEGSGPQLVRGGGRGPIGVDSDTAERCAEARSNHALMPASSARPPVGVSTAAPDSAPAETGAR
jgi:hypothetical protein